MTSLKDAADAYEPKTTKNVVELNKVSIDMDITEKTFQDKEGKDFTVSLITVDEEEYRVPTSVISQVKELIAEMDNFKFFKVTKKGEGLNTKYTVIPLVE